MFVSFAFLASLIFRGLILVKAEFPENIILIIGKGMTLDHVIEARVKEAKDTGKDASYLLSFEKFPCYELLETYNENFTSSSDMSASGLFRGTHKFVNSACERADSYHDNTIISNAQDNKKATGLVTTMRLTASLPATLYGIGPGSGVSECPGLANKNCTDASHILIHGHISSRMDVVFGDGHGILGVDLNDSNHQETKCQRNDGRNLTDEWRSSGPNRKYFSSARSFYKHKIETGEKYFGTFLESELGQGKQLNDVVFKTIQVLQTNENGYLLVVIVDDFDTVNTTLKISQLVKRIMRVISTKNTMVIVTADYVYDEICHEEVEVNEMKASPSPETESKMAVTEEVTSDGHKNSTILSAKIRAVPCRRKPAVKAFDVPFYSLGFCNQIQTMIGHQSNIGNFLMSYMSFSSDKMDDFIEWRERNSGKTYDFDWEERKDNSGVASHNQIIILQLVFSAVTGYFFF